jgi:phosphopantetheine--protein transferase-like protein
MTRDRPRDSRCGLDTVEIARVEKLLRDKTPTELLQLFSATELEDAGAGAGRVASLAARFAAKEACCKLFPRETALGLITPADFSVRRDAYGAPCIDPSPNARCILDRHFLAGIRVSLTHAETTASAIAWADVNEIDVPWFGRVLYYLFPIRRGVVLGNLRLAFGDVLPESGIRRLAQAYCGHYARFLGEFLRAPFLTKATRNALVRVENKESPIRAHARGRGVLLLTGHFGNWEVSTAAGISQFPQYQGLFHFVRRPFKPKWVNDFVNRRFRKAGFGTLSKRGSLDSILELLRQGAIIVTIFDQHASGNEGVIVDFLGHPASTFKSLAILALNTGAPVVPAYSWREPDGTHVLRFEEPLPLIEHDNVTEAIRLNTRAYNAALERMLLQHPEQWIWMHKRWKVRPAAVKK